MSSVRVSPQQCLFVLSCILVFFIGGCATGPSHRQPQANVRSVYGVAQYSTGGAWKRLRPGGRLGVGTVIHTEENSRVTLLLYGVAPLVLLQPDSELALERLAYLEGSARGATDTRLQVRKGEAIIDDEKLPVGSRIELRTPQGIKVLPAVLGPK